jgi:hypothetical protein
MRPALLVIVLVVAACTAACGPSGTSAAGKANGCTAVVTGTSGGRSVVTYTDSTNDPSMTTAIDSAVKSWDAADVDVTLKPAASGGTITFVSADAATATSKCAGSAPRKATVTLDSAAWHGTNGKTKVTHPERDVAREIGHALGLGKGGGCDALMTPTTCSTYVSGPNPAEIAEINHLYPAR